MTYIYVLYSDHPWNDGKTFQSVHATKEGAIEEARTLTRAFTAEKLQVKDYETFIILTTSYGHSRARYEVTREELKP